MAAVFDEETGLQLFDEDTGLPVDDKDTAAVSKALGKSKPAVAPMLPSLKSTGSGRFFTKAAAEEKLRGKVAAAAPTAEDRMMIASRKADKARWDALPDKEKLGSFKTWVETKYAQRTTDEAARLSQATGKKFKGHDVPGVLERAFNVVTDLGSGRSNARGGMRYEPDDPLLQNEDLGGGLAAMSSIIQHGINAIPFGKGRIATDEERDLETYKRLRSPVEVRGGLQTAKDIGGMAITNPKQLAIEMFNPDDAVVNLATAVPMGGVVAKGASLGGKALGLAGKGTKIAANFPRLAKAGMVAADVAGGAALGGGIQTIQGDEGLAQDFATGALPGAIMGGSSAAIGGAARGTLGLARRTMDKLAGAAPDAPAKPLKPSTLITPLEEAIQKIEARKMFEAGDPTAQVQLTPTELASLPEFKKIAMKVKRSADEDALVTKFAPLFVQNLDQFPVDKQAGVLQAAIEKAAKDGAEQAQPAVAKSSEKLNARLEAARQSLPTSKEGADTWFSSGTKKQQDDKLVKASRAYRLLRENEKIDVDPRFEGKTEVDLLVERLNQVERETNEAIAAAAETAEQKKAKEDLLKDNKFRSDALLNEIEWAQKREQILSDINFAGTVQMTHKIPGRILDEFKSLPVESQGIFLRDIDELGSAGEYVRTALGSMFDDLQRIAGTSGYDPKRLRAKIEEAARIAKSSYGGGSNGINGEVGGSPAGRTQGAGQQASEGVYRDVPQGSGLDPMGASIEGTAQRSIGYTEAAPEASAPQQSIAGSLPGQIGYDPSRAGGQINLPDQSTGKPAITMRDEPIGSRNELLGAEYVGIGEPGSGSRYAGGDQPDAGAEKVARRSKMLQSKDEKSIQKILYDEMVKHPEKAELFGIDRDIAIEAADPNSPFKDDLKAHLVDAAVKVKKNGVPKGFF